LTYCAKASKVRASRVWGGAVGSTTRDSSWPILPLLPLPLRPFSALRHGLFCCACWRCALCLRPILKDVKWRTFFRKQEQGANVTDVAVIRVTGAYCLSWEKSVPHQKISLGSPTELLRHARGHHQPLLFNTTCPRLDVVHTRQRHLH